MRFGRGLRAAGDIAIGTGISAAAGAVAGGGVAIADDRSVTGGMTTGLGIGALAGLGLGGYGLFKNRQARTALAGAYTGLKKERELAGFRSAYSPDGMSGWFARRNMSKYQATTSGQLGQMRSAMTGLRNFSPSRLGAGAGGLAAGAGLAYATLPSNLSMNSRDATMNQRLQFEAAKAMIWKSKQNQFGGGF